MRPLTSPPGCDSCLRLTQKISELEGRISILYQIQDEERLLDSLVTFGPAVTTTTARDLDLTTPCLDAAATTATLTNHWAQLGAKPKVRSLNSSTPCQSEPWNLASRGKHGGKLLQCPEYPPALQLLNKFSILDGKDFPPLPDRCSTTSSPQPPGATSAFHGSAEAVRLSDGLPQLTTSPLLMTRLGAVYPLPCTKLLCSGFQAQEGTFRAAQGTCSSTLGASLPTPPLKLSLLNSLVSIQFYLLLFTPPKTKPNQQLFN